MIHQFHQKSRSFGHHQSIKKFQLFPQPFVTTVLSVYVTDNDGSFDRLELINDEVNQRADLNCMEEEADSRLTLHLANARTEGFKH